MSATHHEPVSHQPGLPRSNPRDVGVDPAGVSAFLDALGDHELHSVMLLRGGQVFAEGWFAPYTADRVHLLYSLSKSFCSTAVGFAVAEGLLSLDTRVLDSFPELADSCHPDLQELRLRHVLAMASGHGADVLGREDSLAAAADDQGRIDLVKALLLTRPAAAPGTLFCYNQPSTFTAAAMVQKATGETLTDYLRPRLFDPLGIEPGTWQQDPYGREIGFSGLHLTTEAIAAFGQFVLQRGRWGDDQLLPSAWFDEATRKQVDTSEGNPDWQQGYGFQFWMARHGFRGDGAFGQFCVVLPEHDAVLVTTSAVTDMQSVLDAMWQHLLPAFDRTPGAVESTALSERLAGLQLDRPDLGPITEHRDLTVRSEIDWISGASVSPSDVTLIINGEPHQLSCTADAWHTGIWPDGRPVSARGGVTERKVWACVALLDAPHRIMITEDAPGHATIAWNVEPLGNSNPQGGSRL